MSKKIKILEGIRQGRIGGGESYMISLVENLNKEKFEPVVLSFTDGPMVDYLKQQGIKTYVIHTEKPFDFTVWKKVKKLIKDEQIDIVHAHGTRANSNLFWAAKKLGLPIIYTCHGWSFHIDQNPLVKRLRILGERFLTSKMNVNICASHSNKETGKKFLKNFNAIVIANSIDAKKFNPYKTTYKDIRKELSIPKEELLVVSVARFTLQKRPLELVKAFAKVCEKIKNVKLLMVGDGELKEKTLQLIDKLHLHERIIVQPFRQDVPDILASSDIFVLPSLWEALPIGLLEAMAMGKAVIGTRVDGTSELIQNKENGLLIEINGDVENNLANAIIELCVNKEMREKLQQNAIASIYNKYNVETLALQNEEIYTQLANANS